jgi:hypothetical protein
MKSSVVVFFVAMAAATSAAHRAQASIVTITIGSYIDVSDDLYITGNTLQWETFGGGTPVGDPRPDVPDTTTHVATTLNGNPVQSFTWQPVYQPASNYTYTYTGLNPPLPSTDTTVTLSVLQEGSGGSVEISQQPNSSNGETLILQFDDPASGAHFYSAEISFASAVPEPSTWAMIIVGFVGLGWLAHRRRIGGAPRFA